MSETVSNKQGEWLTEQQLANHLHVSVRHMANLRKAGLPFVQLGSSVRFKLAEVETYLSGNRRLSSHVARSQHQTMVTRTLGGLLS